MIKGLWSMTKVYCGNHSDNVQEMPLAQYGKKLEYRCPCCSNKISVDDFVKMLNHISGVLCEADKNDEILNLTYYKWRTTKISYQVIEHTDNSVKIAVVNRGALG